ncbi:MAG: hypothetical protein LKK08_08945 [Bacteroidales bacterium]|jgi:hypothetical protein|nr:hypothetical protein [Bacteroidales bacterium]MCI2146347.1 hypothetical protein [Bacteroidales bacterium]
MKRMIYAVILFSLMSIFSSFIVVQKAGKDVSSKEAMPDTVKLKFSGIVADSFDFKPIRTQMLAVDNFLVIANQNDGDKGIYLYSLSEGKRIRDFIIPSSSPSKMIFRINDEKYLCGIYDDICCKAYAITRSLKIEKVKSGAITEFGGMEAGTYVNLIYMDKDKLVYTIRGGRNVTLRRTALSDTASAVILQDLRIKPEYDYFFPYEGMVATDAKGDRIVYAYNYFKVIRFMDGSASPLKVLDFGKPGFDPETLKIADGLDKNRMYYYGGLYVGGSIYVRSLNGEKYPYENHSSTIIEQYDRNGNPIRVIELDRKGVFTVDETCDRLYLLTEGSDRKIYYYDLSEVGIVN